MYFFSFVNLSLGYYFLYENFIKYKRKIKSFIIYKCVLKLKIYKKEKSNIKKKWISKEAQVLIEKIEKEW